MVSKDASRIAGLGPIRGRGASSNPANRFESISLRVLGEHMDERRADAEDPIACPQTEVLIDRSKSIINRVDSPDLPFHWTINPYRGCEHGCVYCYARPGHEYLSMSCGIDFETKILAKTDAPELLRKELSRKSWKGEPIMMSGVTDCYQPIESKLRITRQCLQVMAEFGQPVGIVTKSRLILRDIDLLSQLAAERRVHVAISVTTLRNDIAAVMEPRASSPRDRLWTIQRLASAGIPVRVMAAPIIPAINDREIPAILKAAADAGAMCGSYVMLRLPWQLKELFEQWLGHHFPDRRKYVMQLLSEMHGGRLYDATFGKRQTGQGPYARQIAQTFGVFARRYGLQKEPAALRSGALRLPVEDRQMQLFDSPAESRAEGAGDARYDGVMLEDVA